MTIQFNEDAWKKLTPREIEIIKAAAAGASIKKTARDLAISVPAVQNNRSRIIRKLECGNITNAVSILIRGGVIA